MKGELMATKQKRAERGAPAVRVAESIHAKPETAKIFVPSKDLFTSVKSHLKGLKQYSEDKRKERKGLTREIHDLERQQSLLESEIKRLTQRVDILKDEIGKTVKVRTELNRSVEKNDSDYTKLHKSLSGLLR
jgi:chromosome segregation ATPase